MPKVQKELKGKSTPEKTDKPKRRVLRVTSAKIDPASPEADRKVMAVLYKMATVDKNPTVAMFWAKSRFGMGEQGSRKDRKTGQVPTIIIRSEEKRA